MQATAWLAPLALHYRTFQMRSAECASAECKRQIERRAIQRKSRFFSRVRGQLFSTGGREPPRSMSSQASAMMSSFPRAEVLRQAAALPRGPGSGAGSGGAQQALFAGVGADAVVTACASCSLTFKKEYPTLLRPGGKAFSVLDIHEFLAARDCRIGSVARGRPDHLARPLPSRQGAGLRKAARTALDGRSRASLSIEMKDADRCCGFGGIMRVTHRGHLRRHCGRKGKEYHRDPGAEPWSPAARAAACRSGKGSRGLVRTSRCCIRCRFLKRRFQMRLGIKATNDY